MRYPLQLLMSWTRLKLFITVVQYSVARQVAVADGVISGRN
jgi:hypothetical protein